MGLLIFDRWHHSEGAWSRRWLYQSSQPAVAYLTSARVMWGSASKADEPMHSVLNSPMTLSIRPLS